MGLSFVLLFKSIPLSLSSKLISRLPLFTIRSFMRPKLGYDEIIYMTLSIYNGIFDKNI